MFMNIITPYFQKNNAMKPRFEAPKKREDIFYYQRESSVPDNKKSITFTSLKSTLDYIAKARFDNPIKAYEDYVPLKELDLDKISDICEELPVFKGWTAKMLHLITSSFDGILLQTGCIHKCSHCGINAENKLTTMPWDNYTALTDDIGIIAERLGYNPFSRTGNTIQLFQNSDPMMYKNKGKDGFIHNIFDAAKYYYEKTGTRTNITTAGWPLGNKTAQKAAESFVENPGYLDLFGISIHPFHDYMQKSIKAEEDGNLNKAKHWRNKYVNMMVNTIKSTIGLKDKINTYGIILEFDESSFNSGVNWKSSEALFWEILNKLKTEGVDVSYFLNKTGSGFKQSKVNTRSILHIGRGASYTFETITPNPVYPKMSRADAEESAKGINPDGIIYIKPFTQPGKIKGELQRLALKLNFPLPTKDNSKRPPLPKIEIID